MTARRVQVGRDVRVIAMSNGGADLEGAARLSPGQLINLVLPGAAGPATSRLAEVWTWAVIRVGSGGPTYAGSCRWQDADGSHGAHRLEGGL